MPNSSAASRIIAPEIAIAAPWPPKSGISTTQSAMFTTKAGA